MAGDQSPKRSDDASGAHMGWVVLSYLIGGIGVWGAIGWGADVLFDLPNRMGLLIGMLLGMFGATYLIVKRLGT